MEFLVIEKVSTETTLAPDLFAQVPDIMHAIADYNQALTKQGKVKASWNLADTPGGAFVLDVSSGEELERLLLASPSNAFPLTREVHPVTGVVSGTKIIESTIRESIAQRNAMMANKPR